MKKLIVVLLGIFTLYSCDLDDTENVLITYETMPVETISMPDTLQVNQEYNFDINYTRPTSCHSFEGYNYKKEGNERRIAVINKIVNNASNCEDIDEMVTEMFTFKAQDTGTYTFKFWRGRDADGEAMYIVKEVPVVDEL